MARLLSRRLAFDSALPITLLLAAIVLLPAGVVLWLVGEAARNEHLAVRQRLTEAYQAQLETVRRRLLDDWRRRLDEIDKMAQRHVDDEAFAACVRGRLADGVVVLDDRQRPVYPTLALLALDEPAPTPGWLAAQRLEMVNQDYPAAAEAYRQIAETEADDRLVLRAVQGQVRALLRGGQNEAAIKVLIEALDGSLLLPAATSEARARKIDLTLLLAERAVESDFPSAVAAGRLLVPQLNDYGPPRLDAARRRFAMHRLEQLWPGQVEFPTLAAEDLAAEFIERAKPAGLAEAVELRRELTPAGSAGVWQIASPSDRIVALFRTETIIERLRQGLEEFSDLPGTRLSVSPPRESGEAPEAFLRLALGPTLPGWSLSLTLVGDDPFAATAMGHRLVYLGIALVTILATAALALAAGLALGRQRRIARLKNELVATVSHELKTPLAGIRLLVDTLLASDHPNREQSQAYLQLIAQENERLSRLIDNFLNFSRMERGQQQFTFGPVAPDEAIGRAASAMRERFGQLGCHFQWQAEPDLPAVRADSDALVTVLINLLDNAAKYGGEAGRVMLCAYRAQDRICFAVSDRGIGLATRHRRRIFDRFYQIDRRLARTAGGCGLGLSIVQHIVTAHGGNVAVESQLGRGSTFAVSLPIAVQATTSDKNDGLCTTS